MRTMRGQRPVALIRCQPSGDFPEKPGCRGQIGFIDNNSQQESTLLADYIPKNRS